MQRYKVCTASLAWRRLPDSPDWLLCAGAWGLQEELIEDRVTPCTVEPRAAPNHTQRCHGCASQGPSLVGGGAASAQLIAGATAGWFSAPVQLHVANSQEAADLISLLRLGAPAAAKTANQYRVPGMPAIATPSVSSLLSQLGAGERRRQRRAPAAAGSILQRATYECCAQLLDGGGRRQRGVAQRAWRPSSRRAAAGRPAWTAAWRYAAASQPLAGAERQAVRQCWAAARAGVTRRLGRRAGRAAACGVPHTLTVAVRAAADARTRRRRAARCGGRHGAFWGA